MRPEDVLPTYDRVARGYDASRNRTLFERRWLDRMLNFAPGRRVLDLGCGSGRPIATYLADRRCRITGVDGAPSMIALFRQNVPGAKAVRADMRGLDLEERFDAILTWDSFFHLSPGDQRAMFPVFAAHAGPRAVLMITTGHVAAEPIGRVEGEPVYHASLAPQDYADLMSAHGFEVLDYRPQDPACAGHTVWLARARPVQG
ncbi:methyltransferase domain-containing protein [Psychromarinibacter sp. C21-152]|uniref:Methyltransferase domain-containing protein n=1 Tax=Psychromarinibacter sediminicola TaxID=3033385 RepID=A0AAE3NQ75_9RHOB|nr:class I SAM-dependent methyltransferase [Psychromarinibacter sediminicola]MDF0600057.1 methyltransferase domain-containing protein [Psychromarinibacter sediminicola]